MKPTQENAALGNVRWGSVRIENENGGVSYG